MYSEPFVALFLPPRTGPFSFKFLVCCGFGRWCFNLVAADDVVLVMVINQAAQQRGVGVGKARDGVSG
jgi:hypothetical protein